MCPMSKNGRKVQPWDQTNRRQKLDWLGEIERKLAKLSMPLLTVLPLNYFMVKTMTQGSINLLYYAMQ
jgi:hypothetical protein